jgi:hypothetical protein
MNTNVLHIYLVIGLSQWTKQYHDASDIAVYDEYLARLAR